MLRYLGGLVISLLACVVLASPQQQVRQLRQQAVVADSYQTWQRVIGGYWLTAPAFVIGIQGWRRQMLDRYQQQGTLIRYIPPASQPYQATEIAQVLQQARQNPLAIPQLTEIEQARLFASYAPVFEVDQLQTADKIGALQWQDQKTVVDIAQPVVYQKLSYVRWQQAILLQLNYIIWFPERPKTKIWDALAGHLDGIIWRVTLDLEGQPLIYDTIHNCGCYHTFFPVQLMQARQFRIEEDAFIPMLAPRLKPNQIMLLRISAVAHLIHQVQAVARENLVGTMYQWQNYKTLRSLAQSERQRRSVFSENGLIDGTQRGERWFFWPMGIVSAGAMRQWGQHATAFVGRQHFDDPYLLQQLFLE